MTLVSGQVVFLVCMACVTAPPTSPSCLEEKPGNVIRAKSIREEHWDEKKWENVTEKVRKER
jgi:hypothetical protein